MKLKPITLSFPKAQEAEYQKSFFNDSLIVCRVAVLTSAILYAAFGLLDKLMLFDDIGLFFVIRFIIVVPFLLLIFLLSFTKIFGKIWQYFLFAAYLIGGFGIILMLVRYPENQIYYMGLMLVFLAGYFFIRLRFSLASIAGWSLLILFNIMMLLAENLPSLVVIANNFFFISANVLGTFAAYYIEISNRKNFYLATELNKKKAEQEEINKSLEQIVKSRTSELRQSEARFRNLAYLLPLMVYEIDLEGNVTYANEQAFSLLGYTKEDFEKGVNIFSLVAPEDRESAIREFEKSLSTNDVFSYEWQIVKKDRSVFPVIDYSSPIRINNQVIGVRGVVVDVSEQKEAEQALKASEEKYKLLAENAFDGIYLFNGKYFEYVNKQFCKIIEYSYQELTHKDFNLSDILTEESKKLVQQRVEYRKKGLDVPSLYEFQVVTKTGKIKDVEVNTSALKRDNPPLILGIMRDVTEYKKTKKLESEVLAARQSAEFKQNFLANMSHEIRTPLTGIIGLIEIMQKEPLSSRLQEYVKILRSSSENLTEIIDQVLDFSKIEAGKVKLKPTIFKLESLFENARVLFDSLCYKKDLKFKVVAGNDLPENISADEKRLSQIINNLLSNAVKFTEKGTVMLKADLIAREKASDDVVIKIEVTDTGIGIPSEKQEKLFAPFAQIDEQDTRAFEGTGLGLSICKELVNMHGGEIGVYSKYKEGSTFWFTFTARETETEISTRKEKQKPAKFVSKKLKILFAEDKAVNQKVVKLMLTAMGHEVVLAQNGQQAIDLYKPGKFDMILMDIQMPVMDGVTATNELKKKDKKLPPVVGLSANAFEGDREKYIAKGLDEYITKPLVEDDFVRVVEKLGLGEEA